MTDTPLRGNDVAKKTSNKDSKAKRKPRGLQWDLDREIKEGGQKVINNFEVDGCGGGEDINNNLSKENIDVLSPHIPPYPPFAPHSASEEEELSTIVNKIINNLPPRPCLYEHPATRELIRRKLVALGITNVNQLIRTLTAADLLEAISDYERAHKSGVVIRSPTGYFRSLLK